jgi:chromate transporter
MLVTLLGWKVAGWTGALVATLALFVPSSLLCYGVTRMWNHYRGRHWHTALESGLAPIGAGLILAGVFAIFRIAGAGILSWAVAGVSAAILAWRPTLNPLILLAGGAAAFAIWHGMVPL